MDQTAEPMTRLCLASVTELEAAGWRWSLLLRSVLPSDLGKLRRLA